MLYLLRVPCCLWCIVLTVVGTTVDTDLKCASKRPDEEKVVSKLLNIAGGIIESAKEYDQIKDSLKIHGLLGKPTDCEDILSINKTARSGIYTVWPRSPVVAGPINVFCDMDDDGGGWSVIQRRGDFDSGKEYFFQDWAAYKTGFGKLNKDFWLGNDNICALTNQRACSIKFQLSDWTGNWTYATYDKFWIEDEDHKYIAHVSGFRGTAGDSFSDTNGAKFTTKDQDNDNNVNNCAVDYKGAWWYHNCHNSNLNGFYLRGAHETHADGVEWGGFKGHKYSLKHTIIKIRSKYFENNEVSPT